MATKELKPFDPSKPFQRRDGVAATLIDPTFNGYGGKTLLVKITHSDGFNSVMAYRASGKMYDDGGFSHADLVNIPTTKVDWINLYAYEHCMSDIDTSRCHSSLDSAKSFAGTWNQPFLGTIKVVREDGVVVSVELVAT